MCVGFCPGDYESSPKYHCQLVGEPVLVSVKFSVSGAGPESGYGGGVAWKKWKGGFTANPPSPMPGGFVRPGPEEGEGVGRDPPQDGMLFPLVGEKPGMTDPALVPLQHEVGALVEMSGTLTISGGR